LHTEPRLKNRSLDAAVSGISTLLGNQWWHNLKYWDWIIETQDLKVLRCRCSVFSLRCGVRGARLLLVPYQLLSSLAAPLVPRRSGFMVRVYMGLVAVWPVDLTFWLASHPSHPHVEQGFQLAGWSLAFSISDVASPK
jgi:hypothetical protein